MPKRQAGTVVRRGSRNYGVRFLDEVGRRRYQGGFETRTEAETWLRAKVDEIERLRRGDSATLRRRQLPTLGALVDEFVAQHAVTPETLRKVRAHLALATAALGERRIDRLTALDLSTWRSTISAGYRHEVFRTLRQVLEHATQLGLLDENPAARVKNRRARDVTPRRIAPFESWDEIEALVAELDPRFAAIPVFAAGTGLRPEEWIALERRDLDRQERVVHVRRVFTQRRRKELGKTEKSLRRVPIRQLVLDALDAAPPRIDSPLLFPSPRGGYIDLERFRYREWTPALRAAGLAGHRIYDLRHTFASFSIAANVPLFYLARIMGTSVAQIDATYGHLLPDSEGFLRGLLDEWDARPATA